MNSSSQSWTSSRSSSTPASRSRSLIGLHLPFPVVVALVVLVREIRVSVLLEGEDPHIAFDERKNGEGTVALIYGVPEVADRIDTLGAHDRFVQYDDQEIAFFDHLGGALAHEYDIEHVFTFDPKDFRTLGFTVVPDNTGG